MKSFSRTAIAAVAALNAATASAATSTFCPSDGDVCYGWGVPEAAASSGSGNVYFQLKAPTTYSWIGLGIGQGMSGADMFVMYQDGNGNVTISPRAGKGHVMPMYSQRDDIELLEGSGVEGDMMTANVRCSKCDNVDLGSKGSWIGAWKEGDSLDSTSMEERITMHDEESVFMIDLSKASISSDANPFVEASPDQGDSGTNTGSGSGSGSDSDSGATEQAGEEKKESIDKMVLAHGVIMSIVFIFMYPVGSALMPLVRIWWVHSSWQNVAFLLMWAGFALGYLYSKKEGYFFMETHTRLGTIVVALLGLQPILGIVHHSQFKKTGKRGIFSHIHVWYGRALMLLGIINGGLGLRLAKGPKSWIIAYSVIAGVVSLLYVASIFLGPKTKKPRHEKDISPAMTHEDSPRA